MIKIDLHSEQDTIDLAAYIAPVLKPSDVLCLYGDLGSGKTFFTKHIAKMLFVEEEVDSPSFVLFKEYQCAKFPLYHLDLYRLKDEGELLDLGIFDMIESGITLIEWPQLAQKLLPYFSICLHFYFDGTQRWVEIEPAEELGYLFEEYAK